MYSIEKKIERPGREIKLNSRIIKNKNINVKIGTTDNKNHPDTVYISLSFWVDIKNKNLNQRPDFDKYISKLYVKEIKKINYILLKPKLESNYYFPYYQENILTYDFPDNLNYNNKKSFTNIELTLHTINNKLKSQEKIPFKNKNNSELFNEIISIVQIISQSDLLQNKLDFKISKTKR